MKRLQRVIYLRKHKISTRVEFQLKGLVAQKLLGFFNHPKVSKKKMIKFQVTSELEVLDSMALVEYQESHTIAGLDI